MADLGYLLAQRRAASGAGNSGASELGALLGGGGQARTQQIYNQAASQGVLMQDRLQQARQRQQDEAYKEMQRSTRHRAADRVRSTNPGLADAFEGWDDPALATKAQDEAQKTQFSQDAWAARNGDPNALNRMLMVIQGKPVEFQRSLGEGQYTPNAYDTTSQPVVSEIGRAIIGEKGALAGEHNAQAARARAGIGVDKAANYDLKDTPQGMVRVNKLTGETTPLMVNGAPVAKPPRNYTEPEMKAAGLDDPDSFRRFQAVKHELGTSSDPDAYAEMQDQASRAASMGPPSALAPAQPGFLASLFGSKSATPPAARQPAKIPIAQKMVNGKLWYKYNDGTTAPAE